MEGISVCDGVVVAKPLVYNKEKYIISFEQVDTADKIEEEKTRYTEAFHKTKEQLLYLKAHTLQKMSGKEAEIFEAHLMILEDSMLITAICKYLEEGYVAEGAVEKARLEVEKRFETIKDPYIQARLEDVNDVVGRLIRNIKYTEEINLSMIEGPVIVIAKDLSPSDTAQMNERVVGIITEHGSETSHTAIMAKAMGLPALVGVYQAIRRYGEADKLLLDTLTPRILVNPSTDQIKSYEENFQNNKKEIKQLEEIKEQPAITRDGHRIQLLANISSERELSSVDRFGAEGIGLFRTEYIYMKAKDFATEEEQYKIYTQVAREGKEEIIIRTLDIGGDKQLGYYTFEKEINPFLGQRAIRFCLERTDIFKTQLRALLRAATHGPIKIMYPMISSLEQLREANQILTQCKKELGEEGKKYKKNLEVGIMIEVPAAAMIADSLIKEVDFVSIGTNDLCQYVLAVDRMNAKVAKLYEPLHPAVLRLIYQVIEVVHKAGKKVGLCGEIAGEPLNTCVLIGLGVDELSMSASRIPQVKKRILEIRIDQAKQLAQQILKQDTAEAVRDIIREFG